MEQPDVDNQTIRTMYYLGGVMFFGMATAFTVMWNYFKKREAIHSQQVGKFVENSTKMVDLMERVEEHMRLDAVHRAAERSTRRGSNAD